MGQPIQEVMEQMRKVEGEVEAGAKGTTGAQGVQGRTGTKGQTGVKGTTGAGAKGTTGAQGTKGATGSQGARFSTGHTGAKGATGSKGTTGAQGRSLKDTGPWAGPGNESYEINDIVENLGSGYICYVAHSSTGSNEPGVGGNWDSVWDLLVHKGTTGAQGAKGTTGAGAKGTTGAQGAKGTTGAGAKGTTGAQGAKGTTGTKGATGNANIIYGTGAAPAASGYSDGTLWIQYIA